MIFANCSWFLCLIGRQIFRRVCFYLGVEEGKERHNELQLVTFGLVWRSMAFHTDSAYARIQTRLLASTLGCCTVPMLCCEPQLICIFWWCHIDSFAANFSPSAVFNANGMCVIWSWAVLLPGSPFDQCSRRKTGHSPVTFRSYRLPDHVGPKLSVPCAAAAAAAGKMWRPEHRRCSSLVRTLNCRRRHLLDLYILFCSILFTF